MLIINPTRLWFLSFMSRFRDLSATLSHVTSRFLKPAFAENPNIKRLFKHTSASCQRFTFLIFLVCNDTWGGGYLQNPEIITNSPSGLFFLAIRLWLLSSFKLGFTAHSVGCGEPAGHTASSPLSCLQIPLLRQSEARAKQPQTLTEEDGTTDGGTSCLFVCRRNYFLKRGREEKQAPKLSLPKRWDTAGPLKHLQQVLAREWEGTGRRRARRKGRQMRSRWKGTACGAEKHISVLKASQKEMFIFFSPLPYHIKDSLRKMPNTLLILLFHVSNCGRCHRDVAQRQMGYWLAGEVVQEIGARLRCEL